MPRSLAAAVAEPSGSRRRIVHGRGGAFISNLSVVIPGPDPGTQPPVRQKASSAGWPGPGPAMTAEREVQNERWVVGKNRNKMDSRVRGNDGGE